MASRPATKLDEPDELDDDTLYPDYAFMPESTIQMLLVELLRPLLARFLAEQGQQHFVGADQFIYYIKGNPRANVAPDVYVLPGVDPASAPRCVKTWEAHAAPSFALEIMSEVNDLKDLAHSPLRHDELGTRELVVFDPHVDIGSGRMRFRVYRRDAQGRLVLVLATNQDRVESQVLGCFLRACGEGAALRLRIATGPFGVDLFPTDAERAQAEAERAQAEAERAQAAERGRAEAEAEVARLRAELEALRQR